MIHSLWFNYCHNRSMLSCILMYSCYCHWSCIFWFLFCLVWFGLVALFRFIFIINDNCVLSYCMYVTCLCAVASEAGRRNNFFCCRFCPTPSGHFSRNSRPQCLPQSPTHRVECSDQGEVQCSSRSTVPWFKQATHLAVERWSQHRLSRLSNLGGKNLAPNIKFLVTD